jgi:hypothetical protein
MRAYRTWEQIVKDHAPVETSAIDDPTIRDIRTKKPVPRVVEKKLRDAKIEAHRVEVKAAVFKRDYGLCRCCRAHATEMHELRFRSLGGPRSLYNSIAVCTALGGNNCHRMLQTLVIGYEFVKPQDGANGPIRFSMGARVWISEARA